MSRQLINRNEDLTRLENEGYDIEITDSNFLLVRDVPYLTKDGAVARGILASVLQTAGNLTTGPIGDHVAHFIGAEPYDHRGNLLETLIADRSETEITPELRSSFRFSRKPPAPAQYADHYEKMVAYVAILEGHAQRIDPTVRARTYPVKRQSVEESVFKYRDAASSRARITGATRKLELSKVGIVGLGGNGSYVLDLVAKTPVKEIHLFDGDELLSHNVFRAPGAASAEELEARPTKVGYFADLYTKMRYGVVPHPYYLDETNVGDLSDMDFIFLCVDAGDARRIISDSLREMNKPFIDVGISLELVEDSLVGTVRVTTSTEGHRDHFRTKVPLADPTPDDVYNSNIQVADLNALNATMAVIRWKRYCGFYKDFGGEYHSKYCVETNALINEMHDPTYFTPPVR